jgi:hypothetical protein
MSVVFAASTAPPVVQYLREEHTKKQTRRKRRLLRKKREKRERKERERSPYS